MAAAIATLPWVETDSIQTDGKSLLAKFKVKDVKDFDEQLVIATLKKKGYAGAKLQAGPGKKAEPKKADDPPKDAE